MFCYLQSKAFLIDTGGNSDSWNIKSEKKSQKSEIHILKGRRAHLLTACFLFVGTEEPAKVGEQ